MWKIFSFWTSSRDRYYHKSALAKDESRSIKEAEQHFLSWNHDGKGSSSNNHNRWWQPYLQRCDNHLQVSFPKLRKGGWYVVEDIQTSFGKLKAILKFKSYTSMNFSANYGLRQFIRIWKAEGSDGTFDGQIDAVHFHHNMTLIKKISLS